jgi:hypothetical protein
MKILFGNQEYLDVKLSPKEEFVVLTTKTKWDEGSFALASVNLTEDQIDKLITELLTIKTKIKNVKI